MEIKKPSSVAQLSDFRTPQARILKPGEGSLLDLHEDPNPIPFVPAFDLLEAEAKSLSDAELAAVALALCMLLPAADSGPRTWELQAKLDSLSSRN